MRRPPLRIPATGFSFHGPGISYGTSTAQPHPYFRSNDSVAIRDADGNASGPLNFHHTDGSPPDPVEELHIVLEPGDWVSYNLETSAPAALDVTIELTDVRPDVERGAPLHVSIDSKPLPAARGGLGVEASTWEHLPPGPHRMLITSRIATKIKAVSVRPRSD